MKVTRYLLLVTLLFLVTVPLHAASDVTLAWDAATDARVTGYKLHYGSATKTYTVHQDCGNVTQCTLKALPDATYFIAATAYTAGGIESGYSNEVSLTLDTTPPASPKNLHSVSVKVTVQLRGLQPVVVVATTGN